MAWRLSDYYKEFDVAHLEFSHVIQQGPSDDMIFIKDFVVCPNDEGNFVNIYGNKVYSEDEFDAISTFAVARRCIELTQDILGRSICWQWNKEGEFAPLEINIRKSGINARYLREKKCIELDYFGPYENWTYYCRSSEIVAHEIGHAILDGLKPHWLHGNVQTMGVAEAFCDFLVMYMKLTDEYLCHKILQKESIYLYRDNSISLFGSGYGDKENPQNSIRNALNDKQYDPQSQWSYYHCEVITGVLYDLLISNPELKNNFNALKATELMEIGISWAKKVLRSFLECDDRKTTVLEFVGIIAKNFQHSEVLNALLLKRKLDESY